MRYEVGDIIYNFKDPKEYNEYLQKLEAIKKEQEAKPEGKKTVRFYLTRDYRYNYSRSFKLLYKKTIEARHPVTDTPEYKSDYINVTEGRVFTADPEQIAFLDMHKGFVREENRELSPLEKERRELLELKQFKEKLEADIAMLKEQLLEQKAVKEVVKVEGDIKGKKKDN